MVCGQPSGIELRQADMIEPEDVCSEMPLSAARFASLKDLAVLFLKSSTDA
jgi:hypothetical protein